MIVYNSKTKEKKQIDNTPYTEDMEKIVECPECGKKHKFGDGIAIGDWLTEDGMWQIDVCPDCAEKYWDEMYNSKENKIEQIKEQVENEIEYVHDRRDSGTLVREFDDMYDFILDQTDSYTNLSLFANDYIKLYHEGKYSKVEYSNALNDIYLLALLLYYKDNKKK